MPDKVKCRKIFILFFVFMLTLQDAYAISIDSNKSGNKLRNKIKKEVVNEIDLPSVTKFQKSNKIN